MAPLLYEAFGVWYWFYTGFLVHVWGFYTDCMRAWPLEGSGLKKIRDLVSKAKDTFPGVRCNYSYSY